MNGKIKCTNCGNMIPIGAPYCIFCGAKLSMQVNAPQETGRKRKRKSGTVPIVRAGEDVMVPVSVEKEKEPEAVVSVEEKSPLQEPYREPAEPEHKKPVTEPQPAVMEEKTVQAEELVQETEPASRIEDTARPETVEVKETGAEEEMSEPAEGTPLMKKSKLKIPDFLKKTDTKNTGLPDSTKPEKAVPLQNTVKDTGFNTADTADTANAGNTAKNPEETQKIQEKPEETRETKSRLDTWKEKKDQRAAEYELNHDELTGIFNGKAFDERLKKVRPENVCIISCDVNGLAKTNELNGEEDGDLLLKSVAESLKTVFGNNCYRTDEDGFTVVLEKISETTVLTRIGALQTELKQQERKQREAGHQIDIRLAVGYAYAENGESIEDVISKSIDKMENIKDSMKRIYNPNYDGYYNDTKAEYEEIKVQIDRDNMHKVVLLLIGLVLFLVFYFMFFV